jgi:hypothetical protein
MRKLKLELEDLNVESFRTGGHAAPKGTVQAHLRASDEEEEVPEGDSEYYCYTVWIYYETEYDTCGNSCGYSCPVCEA